MSVRKSKHKRWEIKALRANLKPTGTSSNKSRSAWTGAIQALQLPGMEMCRVVGATSRDDQRWKDSRWEAQPWRISRPPKNLSCTRAHSTEPCCLVYSIKVLSSTCFLFFRPLIVASSGVRVYGGDMTCSSLPIWSYIARVSSVSPGNTKGGPGLQHSHIRSCATCHACQARVSSSVRKASFKSSPGRLDLFVKSLSLSPAGEYQPGPLATSWLCKRRHCGSRSPHMVRTSYFLLKSWKS